MKQVLLGVGRAFVVLGTIALATYFGTYNGIRSVYPAPAPAASVAEPLGGNGGGIPLATSYGACTDPGGGLCLGAGSYQLADPVATLSFTALTGGTLSIPNASSMISFTGTAAGSIANASTGTTTFNCSAAANTCYTFGSPASGLSDTIDVGAASGNGFAIQLAGTRVTQLTSAAPLFQNTNAACTSCFTLDYKNAIAQSSNVLQIDDKGIDSFDVYCVTAAGCNAGGNDLALSIGGVHVVGTLANNGLVIGSTGPVFAGTTCAPAAATNAVPEVATATNGYSCVFTTSASGAHTSFQLSFVNTFNTAPVCIVEGQSVAAVATITPSTTSCAWTTTASAGAGTKFDVIWMGGK